MRIGILTASRISLPSLHHMVQNGIQIAMVLPKKHNEDLPELIHFANYYRIPWVQWDKKELVESLAAWQSFNQLQALFVMTFPYIFPQELLSQLNVPFLNFHYAPLPNYAGSQPVFWLIKNGEKKGGIAVHQLTSKVDAGPILCEENYTLLENETFGSYKTHIALKGVDAVKKAIEVLKESNWSKKLKKQNEAQYKYTSRPVLKDVQINWQQMNAKEIERLCRACNPWNNGAISSLNNSMVKIVEVSLNTKTKIEGVRAGEIFLEKSTKQLMISTIDKQFINLYSMYLDVGIVSGLNLLKWGIKSGMQFQD